MNNIIDESGASVKPAAELASLKNITTAVYALQGLSFLWGFTAIVGVIVNYVKRDDVRGTVFESHFDWQIRTFWWGLLWCAIGFVLALVLVGFMVLFIAWIWMIYRVVKGWLKLNDGKPVLAASDMN